MLKLNAAYSKKVPAEGEYTSQSYHASIEVELPDGLSQEQLHDKIHDTFAMVRESVEAELHREAPPRSTAAESRPTASTHSERNNEAAPASPKQLNYLLSLASRRGISPSQIAEQNNVATVADLTKKQCSALIEQWKAA